MPSGNDNGGWAQGGIGRWGVDLWERSWGQWLGTLWMYSESRHMLAWMGMKRQAVKCFEDRCAHFLRDFWLTGRSGHWG